jgi:hypothetical protein
LLLLLALPLAALPACQQEQSTVESYEVAQPNREPMRMLAAVVPGDKLLYFPKLLGPDAEVGRQEDAFREFVRSIRVDEQNKQAPVTWKTPAGWKEQPGSGGMRLATFHIDAHRPIEVTLTYLPARDDADSSVLQNINRWRGQLNLPPAEARQLDGLVERTKIDGREVVLATMLGTGVYHRPVAEKAAPANPHAGMPLFGAPKFGKADNNKLPFRFNPPAEWQPLRPLPAFASEAYQVVDGASRVKITVGMVGGSVADNVVRWRGQLGLPRSTDIQKEIQPQRVAGLAGQYVDLVNPGAAGADNRILGVIVPTEGTNCVIKMSGPDALVGRQKANFEAFVASFQPARE